LQYALFIFKLGGADFHQRVKPSFFAAFSHQQ
jgi:hypothetical protein